MSSQVDLNWADVRTLVGMLPMTMWHGGVTRRTRLYGVPRGGAIVAAMSGNQVDTPEEADFIVDDLIDSGATREKWGKLFSDKPFLALIDKQMDPAWKGKWIRFPWEKEASGEVEDNVVRLLQHLGEDAGRDGLLETPKRVVKALKEMTAGYAQDPAAILAKDFEVGQYDQMIVLRGVEFTSMCEHHMLPFVGTAHVGYIPKARVVGLSKMARLVECFAQRLQVQERLTREVAEAMQTHLDPDGVGVVVVARHQCMSCRGVRKQGAEMVTSSLLGAFRQQATRQEFFSICGL